MALSRSHLSHGKGENYPTTSDSSKTVQLTNPLSLLKEEEISKLQSKFSQDGFAVFTNVLSIRTVSELNTRLEHVLRGDYDRQQSPDKAPKKLKLALPLDAAAKSASFLEGDEIPLQCHRRKPRRRRYLYQDGLEVNNTAQETKMNKKTQYRNAATGPLGYSGNKQKKVFQIINIRKSDSIFQELVISPILGQLVATLMGWKDGARLVQDQVWAKPPGAPPLAYHRDSPYFMFNPSSVATIWIALDNMTQDIGPLTYICSSHKWGDGRIGSTQHFFEDKGGKSLVHSAAERAGFLPEDLEYVSLAGLEAGGLSIHDGRTWHGSGANLSDPHRPRRGIGLHFVPMGVRWTEDASKSKLWSGYVEETIEKGGDVATLDLSEDDFPVTWTVENTDV